MRTCKPFSVISWPVACGLQCLPCICLVVCCQDHLVPYPSPILSSFLSLSHLMLCHACCLSHCHTSSCPSLCVTPLAHTVMVHLVCMPPTISDHLRLHPPTLQCHSDAHCISSHNHATPVTRLNLDQCLISPDLVPMSWAAAYLSFSPYAAFA